MVANSALAVPRSVLTRVVAYTNGVWLLPDRQPSRPVTSPVAYAAMVGDAFGGWGSAAAA